MRSQLAERAQNQTLGIALPDAERLIREIASRTGVQAAQIVIAPCRFVRDAQTFLARRAQYPDIPAGEYMLYNETWTRQVMGSDRVQAVALFGHELGHLFNRDFYEPRSSMSRVQKETEADRFSGCAVAAMGADWASLESLLRRLRNTEEDGGYPSVANSLAAARAGYDQCLSRASPVQPPPGAGQIDLTFDAVRTSAPDYVVAAAPFLHNSPIPIDVARVTPDGSRLVFKNNLGLYGGSAVSPTVSQTFLTQINVDRNGPSSFRLRLGEPVSAVTFQVPAIFPASPNGVTFPAWRATAYARSGRVLSTVSEVLARRRANAPAQRYTLRAPDFEGISEVEFESDWRLNGQPFAGFEAILIEQISLERESN